MKHVAALAALAAVIGLGQPAYAQSWPNRHITMIVPVGAGSPPDIIARIVADRLGPRLGQSIIIENKPGAAGMIGTGTAARVAADGHSILFGAAASLTLSQHVTAKVPYVTERDFAPIIMIGDSPMLIAANPGLGVSTLPELIALAKAKRDGLNFGTPSSRNIPHLTGAMLKTMAGIGIVHVPYQSIQTAVTDTMTGRVQLVIDGIPSISRLASGGKLTLLATTAKERLPGFENIPAVSETLPGFEMLGWFALLAPAGTPQSIVGRLNAEMRAILVDPTIVKRMQELGVYPVGGSPEDLSRMMKHYAEVYGKVVAASGIEKQ